MQFFGEALSGNLSSGPWIKKASQSHGQIRYMSQVGLVQQACLSLSLQAFSVSQLSLQVVTYMQTAFRVLFCVGNPHKTLRLVACICD